MTATVFVCYRQTLGIAARTGRLSQSKCLHTFRVLFLSIDSRMRRNWGTHTQTDRQRETRMRVVVCAWGGGERGRERERDMGRDGQWLCACAERETHTDKGRRQTHTLICRRDEWKMVPHNSKHTHNQMQTRKHGAKERSQLHAKSWFLGRRREYQYT